MDATAISVAISAAISAAVSVGDPYSIGHMTNCISVGCVNNH